MMALIRALLVKIWDKMIYFQLCYAIRGARYKLAGVRSKARLIIHVWVILIKEFTIYQYTHFSVKHNMADYNTVKYGGLLIPLYMIKT